MDEYQSPATSLSAVNNLSTSPTHSLPGIGTSGFESVASLPTLDEAHFMSSSAEVIDGAIAIPSHGRRTSDDIIFGGGPSSLCQSLDASGSQLATPPGLHRALSTSPRLEHTSGDEDERRREDTSEDNLFFPWSGMSAESGPDVELSASLPAGRLHEPLGFRSDHRWNI
jgi:hypothetical protein